MELSKRVCHPLYTTLRRRSSAISWHPYAPMGKEAKLEKYGGKYNAALILGEGKSRERMKALEDLLRCCGAPVQWEMIKDKVNKEGDLENILLGVKRNGVAIKGSLDDESELIVTQPSRANNQALRRKLDLHTFLTEMKTFRTLQNKKYMKDVDVVVVRQNTEGEYLMMEHQPVKNVVEHLRVITRNNSEKIAEAAFRYAQKKKRRHVKCLHRKHTMPLSEDLFIEGFLLAAARHPDIKHEVYEMGEALSTFFKDPRSMDVIVINGLDGIMIQCLLYGALGSPTLFAGANLGDSIAVFEPADRIRRGGLSENPTSYFLCGALMLEYFGLDKYALAIRDSVDEVFLDNVLPKDIGGKADLRDFTAAVIEKVQVKLPKVLCSYNQSPVPLRKPKGVKPFIPDTKI